MGREQFSAQNETEQMAEYILLNSFISHDQIYLEKIELIANQSGPILLKVY